MPSGLGQIGVDIAQAQDKYKPTNPPRPPLPKPPPPESDNPAKLFAAADDAARKGDMARAEKLCQKLKEVDPEGYGLEVDEWLNTMRLQQNSRTDYLEIVKQVGANNLDSARIAWRVYVKKYGTSYDPKGYASLLADTPLVWAVPPNASPVPDPRPTITVPPRPKSIEVTDFVPARPPAGYYVPAKSIEVTKFLPPSFAWCPVPKGSVTLEDASSREEAKRRRYKILAFDIAKYPITNAQYQVFVDAYDGYSKENWWDYSAEARQWRTAHPKAQDTAFEGADLPRTNVTWYEAVAFCRWLSAETGQNVTLPTEQQWQRAAQGDDNREYPWGEEFDADRCNFNTCRPSPVTLYEPEGESPFHVMDMTGNVWEWCLTELGTDSVRLDAKGARVERGGSWNNNNKGLLHTAFRYHGFPNSWGPAQGFRIARN
jgi:formylglycine-generating enzyme required for sulfatase activity